MENPRRAFYYKKNQDINPEGCQRVSLSKVS